MSKLIGRGDDTDWISDEDLPGYEAEGWSMLASVDGAPIIHYELVDGEVVPDMPSYREEAWRRVKALRDAYENGTAPTPFGIVQCDDRSKVKISGLVQMALVAIAAETSFSEPFTMADNSVITLDANMTLQLGVSIGQFVSDVYARGRELRAAIEGAATLEDLNAIDIEDGWPPA